MKHELTTLRYGVLLPPRGLPDTEVPVRPWDPAAEPGLPEALAHVAAGEGAWPARVDPDGVFLALDGPGGEAIGVASCRAGEEWGEVDLVAVVPRHRRRGAGAALLQAVLGHLTAQGLARARAELAPSDRDSLSLFRAHGFEPT